MRSRILVAVLAAATSLTGVSLTGVVGGVAAAETAPGTAANAWTEIVHQRPGGADTYLNDVVVPAADDVWAVGYTFDVVGGAVEFRTFGQHCVAGVCTQANLPNREGAPATNFLFGVDASAPSDIWTVGYSRNPRESGISLAIRYDGSDWRIVNTPNPLGSASTALQAVAAISPTNAFAVGSYQDGSTLEERPLAMRWNGSSWSLVTVPQIPGCATRGALSDATHVGRRVLVTGTCRSTTGEDAGVVLSYAGGTWSFEVVPGDGLLPSPSALESIAVVPGGRVWAVGYDSAAGTGLSVVYNGRSWQRLPVPQEGTYTELLGVAGTSRTDVWAVGATSAGVGPNRLSMHWRAGAWRNVPAGAATSLQGVAYDPAGYWWAVGHNNSVSVVQRLDA